MSSWQGDGSLTKYTTAANTRSLSVTPNYQGISDSTVNGPHNGFLDTTTTMAVIFYESPNASVAVLSRFAQGCSVCPYYASENPIYTGDVRNFSWIDNSPAIRESCGNTVDPSDILCNTPFASGQYLNTTDFSVLTYSLGQINSQPRFVKTIYSPSQNPEDPNISHSCKYQ